MSPIALDPGSVFEVCLETDKSKPVATRPTFIASHLSARQYRAVLKQVEAIQGIQNRSAAEMDEATESDADIMGKIIDDTIAAITLSLSGWKNMTDRNGTEILYTPETLAGILTMSELFELLMEIAKGTGMGGEEKKASESPSPSDSDSSVEPATPPEAA